MKPPAVEVTATLTIEPAAMEKILAARASRAAADFLSAAQLARRWQMHAESIRRMIREKRLPATRIGRRLRISLAEVERLEGEGRTRLGP
jgi:excisionase family DNA binding protein